MNEWWNTTIAGVAGWKLVWAKGILTTLVAGATVFTAAMQGLEWGMLSGTQQTVIAVGIGIAMCNNLISFLSETMKDLTEKKDDKIKL